MKISINLWRVSVLGAAMAVAEAGEFTNLGFDTPSVSWGTASDDLVIPGWSISPGDRIVGVNLPRPYDGCASIWSTRTIYDKTIDGLVREVPIHAPIVVEYCLAVYPNVRYTPTGLWQTGNVPIDAQTLHFVYAGVDLRVFVNGDALPLIFANNMASDDPQWATYPNFVADVSRYAGTTVDLKFEFRQPYWVDRPQVLDGIRFSPAPLVPEPGTFALLGVGGLGLGWWLRRGRIS